MSRMPTSKALRPSRKQQKAPQTAVAPRSLDPNDYEIAVVVDWGTSQCSSAAQILLKGSDPNPNATKILPLQPNLLQVSQIIGFAKIDDEFRFFWGDEFEEIMETNDFQRNELFIFKHPKMFFFPSAVKDRERRKAEKELERYATACGIDEELTLEWLMTIHFKHILRAATSAIHRLWGLT